jgi:F-type H+-transporting ATPase subunit b
MQLVQPELGLIFWQLTVFIILFIVLAKFAWKPILSGLKAREQSIESALKAAGAAKMEMERISNQNAQLLEEARQEKDEILKKATQTAKDLIEEARGNAQKEANKIVEDARVAIENEKKAAINEMKKQVAALSLEIAEKVLRKQLENQDAQKALVEDILKDTKLN